LLALILGIYALYAAYKVYTGAHFEYIIIGKMLR
jgi:hypothetical protein